MIDVLAPTILLVALILLIHRAVLRASSDPSPRKGLAPSHRLSKPDAAPGWHLERKGTTLSIWTSSLNQIPASILHRRGARTRAVWRLVYDLGILAGIAAMTVGTAGLAWNAGAVWKEVWREAELHARLKDDAAHVVKRGFAEVSGGSAAAMGQTVASPGIQPLVSYYTSEMNVLLIYLFDRADDVQIPGVTIPLSHLPTLLLAFVVNQLIHELGHALSGAM